jgi:gamma-glutamyltranspeptidase/glutathione hydrolase
MVAAANNLEVEAGFRILAAGGNAVDAGVAAVLAAGVTEQSRFGLGGEMPAIIHMSGREPVVISGIGTAPRAATPEFYRARKPEPWEQPGRIPDLPVYGPLAAVVPGALDGLLLALQQYGTFSFAQVAAPALEYADGFPIAEEFAALLRNYQRILQLWPTSSDFYFPNGSPPPDRGQLVRYPRLAKTLRELIQVEQKKRGNRVKKLQAVRDYIYRGPLAQRIAQFSASAGALLTYEDLSGFHAELDRPVSITFQGYEIYKPGFWSQGPVMLQALQILEGFDLKSMGHNSAEYLHTVVEAVKLAFADRDRYYGDPKFSRIPADILLSKAYAAERRNLIDPQHASLEHRPGALGPPLDLSQTRRGEVALQDTTCVNVVDRYGNAFTATPSGAWLPGLIAGDTGIPLSTRLQSFVLIPGHPNLLAPGKRPRVTLSPTFVTRNGKPILAMSTPGGDNQDQAMLQVLLNILVFDKTPQEAVEAPRFQTEHFYASLGDHGFAPGKLNLESRIPRETAERLAVLGHRVSITGPWSNSSAPTVILIKDGVLHGGADPRRARFVFGR